MSPAFKEALVTFGRAVFSAGVAASIAFITNVNLFTTAPEVIAHGVVIAFLTGAIMFLGEFLRNLQISVPATPVTAKAKTVGYTFVTRFQWAHYLPF